MSSDDPMDVTLREAEFLENLPESDLCPEPLQPEGDPGLGHSDPLTDLQLADPSCLEGQNSSLNGLKPRGHT